MIIVDFFFYFIVILLDFFVNANNLEPYLLVFPNNGAVLLNLRFRLVQLSSAHLLQLWTHTTNC